MKRKQSFWLHKVQVIKTVSASSSAIKVNKANQLKLEHCKHIYGLFT